MKMVSDVQKHLSTVANSTLANKLLWRDILHHIKLGPGQLILKIYTLSHTDKTIYMILLSIINKLERYGQHFQFTSLLCFDAHLDLLSVDMTCVSTLFSTMRTTFTRPELSMQARKVSSLLPHSKNHLLLQMYSWCQTKWKKLSIIYKCQLSVLPLEGKCTIKRQLYTAEFHLKRYLLLSYVQH